MATLPFVRLGTVAPLLRPVGRTVLPIAPRPFAKAEQRHSHQDEGCCIAEDLVNYVKIWHGAFPSAQSADRPSTPKVGMPPEQAAESLSVVRVRKHASGTAVRQGDGTPWSRRR
jgi:hypothetical protein